MEQTGRCGENARPFFGEKLVVVNIGIRPFFDDLKMQNVEVAQVDWELPAEGEQDLVDLLDKLV